ncbi:beta-hydroxyacyl-(acyl-carrier-protein) dehydratase FabZ [Tolumonas auensis DSM 9187]|uniref:3-hydroxyacyl-[acyl-carrier-protein] dehydratase FabZ n=2 Tax=Tolumonas TaxID=43947 RepID=FABZ_TOLAT|nr:3-hydroxyacyl-ACP dehydratase FabZ [Tolumonas auensis]C4L853.1 RecName: Full=3-hydroxyacyl-[acyl-carrier-protein] dehydratase FabZ; AltName: Full=(3R)-hydroxymyristoyl-[acyl-carrier-protein] dehydratase; Short=(3R)-hydroxymyristoyl-ACP dehydrase; AltName: Full=Beta-hydroxyacyl-ACP dehydratase [Tolumonas auensis DSM 9187]ACQ93699.1 beta-hydroxyacyl-(acyl-carrier-protein) dehydratase FabZ [Tolumonas auensis DSM 9187]
MNNELNQLDIQDILQLLPHRYPFLMVDRVVHYEMSEERKVLRAIKNVSFNEPFFQGHFPERPVFPGVLILEAMAQATGILAFRMVGKPNPGELYYFASIDNARFKRPVVPGDQLVLDVEYLKERRGIAKFTGVATVDGELVCSAELMCAKR